LVETYFDYCELDCKYIHSHTYRAGTATGKIPQHLSYSHLHLLACPYAAWLRYEHALKGPTTPWLALGTSLHHAIEKAHMNGPFDLKFAVDLFKTEFQRIITDEEVFIGYPLLVKLRGEGMDMLGLYNAQVKDGKIKNNPLALEKTFEIPIAGTKLVGKIDKIEIDDEDGEYIGTDFKSGKAKPQEFDLRHNLQLTAYYWAIFDLYGRYPKKMVWHHLRTGEFFETTRTPQDVEDLKTMISNAVFMKQNNVRHRIFHDGVCNYCDYKPTICEDYQLESELIAKGT